MSKYVSSVVPHIFDFFQYLQSMQVYVEVSTRTKPGRQEQLYDPSVFTQVELLAVHLWEPSWHSSLSA